MTQRGTAQVRNLTEPLGYVDTWVGMVSKVVTSSWQVVTDTTYKVGATHAKRLDKALGLW
jgi:hypothetical protein